VPDYTTVPQHDWEGAAYLSLTEKQAARAAVQQEGIVRVKAGDEGVFRVIEVVCRQCRRPWEDVHHDDGTVDDCVIGIHLRGGPIGERKKRKGVVVDGGDTAYPIEDTPIYRDVEGDMRGPV
jgi:hypothetical protein